MTRRERKQLLRTASDIFRMVPLAVSCVVVENAPRHYHGSFQYFFCVICVCSGKWSFCSRMSRTGSSRSRVSRAAILLNVQHVYIRGSRPRHVEKRFYGYGSTCLAPKNLCVSFIHPAIIYSLPTRDRTLPCRPFCHPSGIRADPFHGVSPAGGVEGVPEHAAIHVPGITYIYNSRSRGCVCVGGWTI